MILAPSNEPDYALIDSGNGKKLERFGAHVLSRPDPQALWDTRLTPADWAKQSDATFMRDGKKVSWHKKPGLPTAWPMHFSGLTFEIIPTTFKHTGLFPEQRENWHWMQAQIAQAIILRNQSNSSQATEPISVLNLFGYTGGASLACASAGTHVTHVDGSKTAIEWAKKNQKLSELDPRAIRWILDDAVLFLKREIKRGTRYDAIVMDPPAFGHGPKGEIWKIEEQFTQLIELCQKVLSDTPIFVVVNGYASGYSAVAYANNLLPLQEKFGGMIESGELALREESFENKQVRLLPCGIFARWHSS